MKNQILKLCRRWDKFTIDNLLMITEMETEELLPIVQELLAEGKISESNRQYCYYKKVSDELLESKNAEFLSKEEVKEFKKIYSYLARWALQHNKNKHNLPQKLNEFLWRRNKDFEQLYFELEILIGGKYET